MTHRIYQNIIFTLLFIPLLKPAHTQEPFVPVEGMWIPDGLVSDFEVIDNIMYVGGRFFNVGPHRGSAVAIDRETHELTDFFPMVEGGYLAEITGDGSGGWFLGGEFYRVGGVEQKLLAHIFADGSVDLNWHPDLDVDRVTDISLSGSVLYVAVVRNDVVGPNGSSLCRLVAFDAATGEKLNWTVDLDGYVLDIAVADSGVYACGDFTVTRGSTTWQNLAEFDKTTGEPTDWNPQPDDIVSTIDIAGNQLLAGGRFHSIGGSSRDYLACFDRSTGLATDWYPTVDDDVTSLQIEEQTVYISGSFISTINGEPRDFTGAVDLLSGDTLAWDPRLAEKDITGGSLSFTVTDSSVFISGSLRAEPREDVAFIETDRITGELKSSYPAGGSIVNQVLVEGDLLILSGALKVYEGVQRVGLAAIDLNTGLPTDWDPGINERIWQMEVYGSTMFVNTLPEPGFSNERSFWAIDIPTGNVIPDMNLDIDDSSISIKVIDDSLFVSGIFSTVNGQPRTNFAEFDLTDFTLTDYNPQPDRDISSYVEENGIVCIAGAFTEIDSKTRTGLAAFDKNTRELTDWNPSLPRYLGPRQMVKKNGNLYIGGDFQTVNSLERNGLASFNLETGELNSWNPENEFSVIRFGLYNDMLLVSTADPYYPIKDLNYLRAYDLESGEDRTDEFPVFNYTPIKMEQIGDEFFVGGFFSAVNGRGFPFLARFRRGISSEGWVIH